MTKKEMKCLSEQAMLDAYEEEKAMAKHNKDLIESLGEDAMEQFECLTEDLSIYCKIKVVDGPQGRRQEEDDTPVFKEVHVDQTTNGGYSGDDFAGYIYTKTDLGWLKIFYSC